MNIIATVEVCRKADGKSEPLWKINFGANLFLGGFVMKQNGLSVKFLLLLAAVSIQALFSCKNNHSVQQVEKFKIEFGTVSGCG